MTEKNKSIGLWKSEKQDKNGNFYYSGKIEGTDQWIKLFKNNSTNTKAPALNLLLPEGFQIVREVAATIHDVAYYHDQKTQQKQEILQDDDIPF